VVAVDVGEVEWRLLEHAGSVSWKRPTRTFDIGETELREVAPGDLTKAGAPSSGTMAPWPLSRINLVPGIQDLPQAS